MRDALNRQRWAVDQMRQARAAHTAEMKSIEAERAERLAGLRMAADGMKGLPNMADTLKAIQAQIAALS